MRPAQVSAAGVVLQGLIYNKGRDQGAPQPGALHQGLPRIWKLRHAEPALPSCSRKEVLLAARPISGNNRKSIADCNIFHLAQYCPDDVFLVLIRLFKA